MAAPIGDSGRTAPGLSAADARMHGPHLRPGGTRILLVGDACRRGSGLSEV